MNLLKLNDDKTEFLMVGTQYQLSVAGDLGITKGQDLIKSCSGSAKSRSNVWLQP